MFERSNRTSLAASQVNTECSHRITSLNRDYQLCCLAVALIAAPPPYSLHRFAKTTVSVGGASLPQPPLLQSTLSRTWINHSGTAAASLCMERSHSSADFLSSPHRRAAANGLGSRCCYTIPVRQDFPVVTVFLRCNLLESLTFILFVSHGSQTSLNRCCRAIIQPHYAAKSTL